MIVPALAALGAALSSRPLVRRGLLGAVLALGTLWSLVVFTPFPSLLASGIERQDPLAPADAIFVFSSRVQGGGGLTSVAQTRVLRGLELVQQGLSHRLILSELRRGPSEAAAVQALMASLGVHADILTVGPVWNTHDEAVAVGALARERGFHRILGVTSPLHSRRACLTLEAQGLEVVCAPGSEPNFDLKVLDREGERAEAFRAALHERLGLLVYKMRGWILTSR
jgi:uncharacterized SAM-binding protein YcdF (DUF218 family)